MTVFFSVVVVVLILMIYFSNLRKKKILNQVDNMREVSQKAVRIDNINHVLKNKRNNYVLVYGFGKIELEPGQLTFINSGQTEQIFIPEAHVKLQYKKLFKIPIYPKGISEKEMRKFYLNNLKVYIVKERFQSLII